MAEPLETLLRRWHQAGLIDAAQSDRIRQFEAAAPEGRSRWPAVAALAAGALMLGAAMLLFVAAHWADLSPGGRLLILLVALAGFHTAGAWTIGRLPALGTTLHALGTVALGAAVFLAGQTYHLETDWPRGFLLWALGAWAGVALLRDWPQLLFAALLTPAWLVAEWLAFVSDYRSSSPTVVFAGLLLLSLVYLFADGRNHRGARRATLAIVGVVALLPLAAMTALGGSEFRWHWDPAPGLARQTLWWAIALGGPLVLAWALRGRVAWQALVAAAWAVAGVSLGPHPGVVAYLWTAVGALGLIASGVTDASRRRINLGMAGFALTVVVFYFSSVLDRLGRATSLAAGGALFLLLGWGMERARRRLVARVGAEAER